MHEYQYWDARVLLMRRKMGGDEYKEDRVYDLDKIGCDNYESSMAIKALNEEQLTRREGRSLVGFLEKFIHYWKMSDI